MAKPTDIIKWVGAQLDPGLPKQNTGWIKGERPPFQFINWILRTISDWLFFLSGTTRWKYVISTNTNEADFPDIATYLGGSPAAGDKVLIKNDQTSSVNITFPAGIHFHIEKGIKFIFDTAIATSCLEIGSNVTIEGELLIDITNAGGTQAKVIYFNGEDSKIGLCQIDKTQAGSTITDAVAIAASKNNNIGNFIVTKSGGGTITNYLTDSSTTKTNLISVSDGTNINRSIGAKTFSDGLTFDLGSDVDGDLFGRDNGVVTRIPKGRTHTSLIADEEDSNYPKWQAIELQTTIEAFGVTVDVNGVAYNNGLFVAVGDEGKIATSPNGITWTQRTSGLTSSQDIRGITWDPINSLFIAVGGEASVSYALITSPDGITWTPRTHNLTTDPIAVASNNSNLIVATGVGEVSTSPDGITWTIRAITMAGSVNNVFHNKSNLWVIVGQLGTLETSPDGINWTVRTSGFGATSITGVTYATDSRLIWVIVGLGKIATSSDGITWTLRETISATFKNITVDIDKNFIAVGSDTGEANIHISDGGYYWKKIATVYGDTADRGMFGLTYSDGKIVIVSQDGFIATGFSNLL